MLLVSSALVGLPEKDALNAVIDSGWLTMGERVEEFEREFAAMHGARDCVAVSSCTAGLHLILHALGIGPGDEVLVPSLTFVATANAVLYVGAKPVFVDIESENIPLISVLKAEKCCNERTKAVILMHFAGYLCDREAWQDFARRKGIVLIEDAAHAIGVEGVGTFGAAAAFSFYGNKNMTTAEGGAVIAHDEKLLQNIRQARGHGMTTGTHQRLNSRTATYDVTMLGFNYRMDELRAAIGQAQLQNLPGWNEIRRILAVLYRRQIATHCPEVVVPFDTTWASANHIMPVLLPAGTMRQEVINHLRSHNIQTTIHYPPVHKLSLYRELQPGIRLPLTEAFAERELTLPLHPQVTSAMVEDVVRSLATVAGGTVSAVHAP